MANRCPICDAPVEHVRRERPQEPSAHPEARPGPHATIEVDELCAADDDEQWDRICTKAAVERGGGEIMSPVLEVFYHHFEDESETED